MNRRKFIQTAAASTALLLPVAAYAADPEKARVLDLISRTKIKITQVPSIYASDWSQEYLDARPQMYAMDWIIDGKVIDCFGQHFYEDDNFYLKAQCYAKAIGFNDFNAGWYLSTVKQICPPLCQTIKRQILSDKDIKRIKVWWDKNICDSFDPKIDKPINGCIGANSPREALRYFGDVPDSFSMLVQGEQGVSFEKWVTKEILNKITFTSIYNPCNRWTELTAFYLYSERTAFSETRFISDYDLILDKDTIHKQCILLLGDLFPAIRRPWFCGTKDGLGRAIKRIRVKENV